MPTYEYRCPECGNEFEKFGKMSDPPVTECPNCQAEAQRKISGGAGLLFKGSGFYITDYGKDGKGPRKAEGEKPAAESKPDAVTRPHHSLTPSPIHPFTRSPVHPPPRCRTPPAGLPYAGL